MKIIDRYILSLYLTRLLSVFLILMFIFIIQTFWLFIDEFAGKGIDIEVVFKFLAFYSPKLYPLVMPLSVLLASIMTYGTLAENYEFAAMKSTGISLQRALMSLVVFHFFLGIGSFYFSNHVIPLGEFKYFNLRRNLAKLKPALAITEGVFNEIGEMNIKVTRKYGEDDRFLDDVIIHEKTPDNKNRIVIKAKRGELKSASIGQELQLILFDGNRYEEIYSEKAQEQKQLKHAKVSFEEYVLNIDLSQFNNVDLEEEKYTSTYRMQKVDELNQSIDSLEARFRKERVAYARNFVTTSLSNNLEKVDRETFTPAPDSVFSAYVNPIKILGDSVFNKHAQVIRQAKISLEGMKRNIESKKRLFFTNQKRINLHKNSLHEKYTLGVSILLLFLIGASLGAIIRKGGLGLPMVLAILIFLTFHYIGLFGKNASEDSSISPLFGSWLSTLIIAPFALYFTQRASSDKGLINLDAIIVASDPLISSIKNSIFATTEKIWKRKR